MASDNVTLFTFGTYDVGFEAAYCLGREQITCCEFILGLGSIQRDLSGSPILVRFVHLSGLLIDINAVNLGAVFDVSPTAAVGTTRDTRLRTIWPCHLTESAIIVFELVIVSPCVCEFSNATVDTCHLTAVRVINLLGA